MRLHANPARVFALGQFDAWKRVGLGSLAAIGGVVSR